MAKLADLSLDERSGCSEVIAADLAAQLGLHRSNRGEWRGRCPCCGYPAFVVSVGRGGRPVGWCASCQDKHAVAAMLAGPEGWQPRGTVALPNAGKAADAARKTERALALWNGAEPVPGTPAEAYLRTRCIEHVASSSALRFRADTPHPAVRGRLPALLAAITAPNGGFAGIQRIYLRRDGTAKADIEPQRASLGPVHGGAVRLDEAGPELVVGEGIETTAAAGKLTGLPAWSAVACGNLARSMALPELVRSVTVAVDRDPPGERAAHEAAWRWKREGRRVRLMVPDHENEDANDILMERRYAR